MGTMFSQYSQILALSQLDKVNTGMFYISIEGVPICAGHVLAAFLYSLILTLTHKERKKK